MDTHLKLLCYPKSECTTLSEILSNILFIKGRFFLRIPKSCITYFIILCTFLNSVWFFRYSIYFVNIYSRLSPTVLGRDHLLWSRVFRLFSIHRLHIAGFWYIWGFLKYVTNLVCVRKPGMLFDIFAYSRLVNCIISFH